MRRNYCRSVISLQEALPHSLWISLDLHGILAIVWTPAYPVLSICVCWPPKRRVYNITSSSLLHRRYLLLLCCLLKVSQYRLTLIDTASVHIVKGITHHIHNTPSWLPICWNCRYMEGFLIRGWDLNLPVSGTTSVLAGEATLGAAGSMSPSQSATSPCGWGFRTVRGGFDPRNLRFCPRDIGIVEIWKDF